MMLLLFILVKLLHERQSPWMTDKQMKKLNERVKTLDPY